MEVHRSMSHYLRTISLVSGPNDGLLVRSTTRVLNSNESHLERLGRLEFRVVGPRPIVCLGEILELRHISRSRVLI